jgi:hypothetical protein
MTFVSPTLNLLCNIWKQYDVTTGPPAVAADHVNVPCNLQYARKIHGSTSGTYFVLLPKATDVQDATPGQTQFYDIIECPAGTKRWYAVSNADDVAKGFPTEYRVAECTHANAVVDATLQAAWMWTIPYP